MFTVLFTFHIPVICHANTTPDGTTLDVTDAYMSSVEVTEPSTTLDPDVTETLSTIDDVTDDPEATTMGKPI